MTPKPRPTQPTEEALLSLDEIIDCFRSVEADIGEISKLTTQETSTVTSFLTSLKQMAPHISAIAVSPSLLPSRLGAVTQAYVDSTGNLVLTFEDGRLELLGLGEPENRDLLVAVAGDILPKLEALIQQPIEETPPEPIAQAPILPEPQPAPEIVAPEPLPEVPAEAPVELEAVAEEPPQAPPEEEDEPPAPELPISALSAEETVQIEAVAADTLSYLEQLGTEVFEQAPVSKYFDDWMVNLRQTILMFESNEIIGPDEAFTAQSNQIFGDIEDELARRQAADADIAVSARAIIENRYLLNKIDEGYVAQTKELVVKGKSAIDYLTDNLRNLEKELAEVQQEKVSYRHPLKKMAKDQKVTELTQKLAAAKKRLALALQTSTVDKGKIGVDIDAEYEAHARELEDKRKSALDFLSQEVQEIQAQLTTIKKTKTSNPIKRVALQQQEYEATQKLLEAQKRLELAEQTSGAEQEQLRAEYEKKKQAALGKVTSLEKDIANKQTDDSAEARKAACNALAEAVKARVQRKIVSPPPQSTESL
jgi:hypothetical protein